MSRDLIIRFMVMRVIVYLVLFAGGMGAIIVLAPMDLRGLLLPLLAISLVSLFFWTSLWHQDHELPIFDIGSFYMLGIAAYAGLPLLWHALSGMEFTLSSHWRLYQLSPTPNQFAEPAWRFVVLMIAFAGAYLAWRPVVNISQRVEILVPKRTVVAVLSLFILLNCALLAVRVVFGVNFATAYDEVSLSEHDMAYRALPLFARQLISHSWQMMFILNAAIVVLLVSRWRSRGWRMVLIGWLAATGIDYFLNPGGRFRVIALMLFTLLAFHRFVRPINGRMLSLSGVFLIAFFFVAGLVRGIGSDLIQNEELLAVMDNWSFFFTIMNEFQIYYGSVLEFGDFLENGLLYPIPWQLYFSDVLLLVPQQLLPFEKIDPVQWYVDITRDPDLFVFGVLTQSMLGLGWVELVLRGLALGIALAAIRGWWARHPERLWRNVFYIWLSVVIYQSARNSSFYFAAFIFNYFLPLILGVWVIEQLLLPGSRRHAAVILPGNVRMEGGPPT